MPIFFFKDVFCITFLQRAQVMELAEVHVKRSVILMDRFGPNIFSTVRMKGQAQHRAPVHLNVPH